MAKHVNEEVQIKVEKNTFKKDSILKSKKYFNSKDLLNALLKEDVEYTLEEVDALIENFRKGKVN